MTEPIHLHTQVKSMCEQVMLRSEYIQRLTYIQAKLDAFCLAMKTANQQMTASVQQLEHRVPLAHRSLKNVFIVFQIIADLQEIEEIARLRQKAATLRQQAAALEASAQGLRKDAEEFRLVMQKLQAAREKGKTL